MMHCERTEMQGAQMFLGNNPCYYTSASKKFSAPDLKLLPVQYVSVCYFEVINIGKYEHK